MIFRNLSAALLLTTGLCLPAAAQDRNVDAALQQIEALQAELAALRAEVEALRAETATSDARQAAIAETQSAVLEGQDTRLSAVEVAAEKNVSQVAWKGAPVISGDGWSFKPRGRLQFAGGHLSVPDAIDNEGRGWTTELRRARLGVEGKIRTNIGYKLEVDFADNEVEFADAYAYLSFGDAKVAIGNQNTGVSLEELTSSRYITFIERSALTDAFGLERRAGIRVDYAAGDVFLSGGVFANDLGSLIEDGDNQWSLAARAVYAPVLGKDTQLHIGASVQHTEFADEAQTVRYRQRPGIHSTDLRLVNTDRLEAASDTLYGAEAAVLSGPLHVAGEVMFANVDGLGAAPDAGFWGGYVEAGYFLSGGQRTYKDGTFGRPKVAESIATGGAGAWQIAARLDHIDLVDGSIDGGKQTAYQAALNWYADTYLRFFLNYNHLSIDGGPFAVAVDPVEGGYSADSVGVGMLVDF
ncbi:hypothetical protein KCG44_13205 [Pacificimonas sp. WHA3]|uniref:Porin n=1 Tax=Pacificimonas pallii TaxID=2827236 RepID=A0ABS6SH62_9SPHN|nr:porin [Pacificimonas pallii]MBV7257744.1 hypothetical protein [Pacificimonas pallii]